jgi:hypothetical protein
MPVAAQELTRLANEGDALVVRNTLPGITIFGDDQLKQTTEWQGAGDPNGGDVMEVSALYLKNPHFRKAVLREILVIEDAPEILRDALAAQKSEWDSRQQAKADSASTLQRMADRTIARGLTCIAPKGKALCGNISLVVGQNPNERPPLCAEHQHMVNEFVPSETGRVIDNKNEIVWKRVGLVDQRRSAALA